MIRAIAGFLHARTEPAGIENRLPGFFGRETARMTEVEVECLRLLKAVLEQAIGLRHDQNVSWTDILNLCEANHVLPSDLFAPDSVGETLVEEALRLRDLVVARFFHSRMESGTYARGRIVRTESSLYTIRSRAIDGPCLCPVADGGTYIGDVRGTKLDGHGQIFFPTGDTFEGRWREGEKFGECVFQAQKGTLAARLYGTKPRKFMALSSQPKGLPTEGKVQWEPAKRR